MRVLFMTNDTIEAKYIMQELEKIVHLEVVIIELKTSKIGVKLLQRCFGTSRYYDLKSYLYSKKDNKKQKLYYIEKPYKVEVRNLLRQKVNGKSYLKKIFVNHINDKKTKQIIKDLNPDWIIVFGTSIIKQDILELGRTKFLNIHFSILPNYRGAMSEFWQSYHGNYETVGVTLHEINSNVDEGDCYAQYHTGCSEEDNYILMRYYNILNAVKLLNEQLINILDGKVTARKQGKHIKTVYKSKMLTDTIKLDYYVQKGMV